VPLRKIHVYGSNQALYGIDQAEAFARTIPGFDLLAPQERQLAVDTAVGIFRNAFRGML
jgi:hypothetical protein